jgi:predicted nucleic acid-binding protein
MRVALDTNILAYAEGVNGAERKRAVLDLVQRLPQDSIVLPAQTLGELFHVLVRKAKRTPAKARAAILGWSDAFPVADTSGPVLQAALDLATDHHLSVWDAVVLAASAAAGCRLLLSEDLHDGFTWSGVTVSNPFASSPHPLFQALLTEDRS